MSFASKYSKKKGFTNMFEKDLETDYVKPEQLAEGKTYQLTGFYFNQGMYGTQACAVTKGNLVVNLPIHMTKIVAAICEDDVAIDAVNAGHAGITQRSYIDKNNVKRYSINFVDID